MHYNTKYRIVKDGYLGFEVQSWKWWLPFWMECTDGVFICNTHKTIDEAKEFIAVQKMNDKHRVFHKE